jgi:hypothetical protein
MVRIVSIKRPIDTLLGSRQRCATPVLGCCPQRRGRTVPKIVLISRRVGGMSLTEYLNEQNGHSVVRTPAGFWSQRKRAEFGGQPPRPVLSVASDFSAIGTLAFRLQRNRHVGRRLHHAAHDRLPARSGGAPAYVPLRCIGGSSTRRALAGRGETAMSISGYSGPRGTAGAVEEGGRRRLSKMGAGPISSRR